MGKPKINIGVIPAAGPGARMGHLGGILPKCLFPLYDRPIIYYIIQNMKMVGVKDIYVIVNYQRQMVSSYLKEIVPELGIKVNFISQKELKGIADAIMLTERYIDQPFITILGDDVTLVDSLENLVEVFFAKNAVVVEGTVKEKDIEILRRTCCIRLAKDKRIIRVQEKPRRPFSNLRGAGIYIFGASIFDYIKNTPTSAIRNEREITHTIGLVAEDGRAFAESIKGTNINVNDYNNLLEAWLAFQKYKLSG